MLFGIFTTQKKKGEKSRKWKATSTEMGFSVFQSQLCQLPQYGYHVAVMLQT